MAYTMTAAEAAHALGVSAARVYQLLEAGALAGERIGRTWLVDDASAHERVRRPIPAGRPRIGAVEHPATCILMNRTHEVLEFTYDEQSGSFGPVNRIIDAERAPLGIISARKTSTSSKALRFWWAHRAIPGTREGLAQRLRELGVDRPEQLPFSSLGLSLSDQYWIRPAGADVRWEDINYFHNSFDLGGNGWLASVGLRSPDNTSEGKLPKRWAIENGARILLKGSGPLGQEPYNELVASLLHGRLLAPERYVAYEVRQTGHGPVSACRCFLTDTEEYIPAFYMRQTMRQANHLSDYRHLIECCARLGIDDAETCLAQMIVCDDIIGNFDRHLRNFGIIRDVETLACRMAPLFDTGSCLWCNITTDDLRAGRWKFATKPFHEDANRQLRLVDDYSWFNVDTLDGFASEAAGILAASPALADRVDSIAEAIGWRVERIRMLL